VTLEESNAHAAPGGKFVQLRATASLNPPVAVSVSANFAAPPGNSLCAPGAALIVKSLGAPRAKKTSCPFASFPDQNRRTSPPESVTICKAAGAD
jgi:hypothetical protein